VQADVGRLVDGGQAGGGARIHQVARHLGLAVGGDHLAAGEVVDRDRVPLAAEHQLDGVVDDAVAVHAVAHARLVHQVHGHLLQDAGADAAQHVVAGLPLQDDVVDAGLVQQLAEQEAGGAGADDGDLGAHGCVSALSVEAA
jgi:hypothetical protein